MSSSFILFANIKNKTILPICQSDNLVSGRMMVILKSGY